jgi:uncharacterized membrane protein HdeD (DUF308 family)
MRAGAREVSAVWWWFLLLGILWTWFGMYVLSYRVGSLAAVAAFVGVAFLVGGISQLVVASRVRIWRWLYIISGILAVAAGIGTFFWPDITLYVVSILVAWYLIFFGIIHLIDALAGPKVGWWWTGLLLGIAELVLGIWAVRSWERSLLTLMTLVGVWAIVYGVNEIFAAFTLRETGKQAERAADSGRVPDSKASARMTSHELQGSAAGHGRPDRPVVDEAGDEPGPAQGRGDGNRP